MAALPLSVAADRFRGALFCVLGFTESSTLREILLVVQLAHTNVD